MTDVRLPWADRENPGLPDRCGWCRRYLQDKGKGRGGDGGDYRRNAARELKRFHE